MTQLANMLHQARQGQRQWASLDVATRLERLRPVRRAVTRRADEIAALLSAEVGKPHFEGIAMEVLCLLESLSCLEQNASRWLAPQNIPLRLAKHRRSTLYFMPRGVVALIAPFNFPFAIAGGEIAAALAAGNGVLLKPSEWAPRCAERLLEIFQEADLPTGLLQLHAGGPEAGAALLEADVDYVSFTGSTAAGRKIAARCGERLLPHRVELGGKASALVLSDAEVERSAAALVWGAFANAGQICAGIQRAYIVRSRYEEMVSAILREAGKLHLRPAGNREAEVGPVRLSSESERVQQWVDQALQAQAQLCFGSIPAPGSRDISPLILRDVPADAAIVQEECFAPVLALVPVADAETGLAHVNALQFGLMTSVFGHDLERTRHVARRVRAGTVMINDVVWTYGMPETPWQGVKHSGLGVSHGAAGLQAYCEMRHINEPRGNWLRREPFWFPYSAPRLAALRAGIRALYAGPSLGELKSLLFREKR